MVNLKKPLYTNSFPIKTVTRVLTPPGPYRKAHVNPPAHPKPTSPSLPSHTSPITSTKLMKSYFDHGLFEHARRLFDEIPERDVIAWTAMITGYTSADRHADAWAVFREMMLEGVGPNAYTVSNVLRACRGMDWWLGGAVVHGLAVKFGVDGQMYVENTLLDVYSTCGGGGRSMHDARAVFEGIAAKTAVTWTTMIAGYVRRGDGHAGVQLFRRMLQEGVELNPFSCSVAIRACASIRSLASGRELHAAAVKSGNETSLPVANSLVDMYCRCMSLSEAKQYLDEMPRTDLITWNAMIAGFERSGSDETLQLLLEMGSKNLQPNCFTFTSILAACGEFAVLNCGQQVHGAIIRRGFGGNLPLTNALIDMYAKCGSIRDSSSIFNEMARKDLVSWTSMMIGYGTHGYAKEATELFDEMIFSGGFSPDLVAFIGVLSACSHAGLVDQGLKYFSSMVTDYNLLPNQEIYGCVVDLLGRAGRIEEAYELMEMMPFEPDESVWGALLGACRVHGNAGLGELAARKILRAKPDGPETYIILSNIYAVDGEWGEFARTRRMLRGTGNRKEAGRSWIQVRNGVCSFVVGDGCHPQMGLQVYGVLEMMLQHMKDSTRYGM